MHAPWRPCIHTHKLASHTRPLPARVCMYSSVKMGPAHKLRADSDLRGGAFGELRGGRGGQRLIHENLLHGNVLCVCVCVRPTFFLSLVFAISLAPTLLSVSFSLSLSLSPPLPLSFSFSLLHFAPFRSLSHARAFTHSLALALALALDHALTIVLFLSLSFSLSLFVSFSLLVSAFIS